MVLQFLEKLAPEKKFSLALSIMGTSTNQAIENAKRFLASEADHEVAIMRGLTRAGTAGMSTDKLHGLFNRRVAVP